MLETIQELDTFLFYMINHGWSSHFLDKVMKLITEVDSWVLLYLFGFYFLFFKSGKKGKITAIALILAIIFTDQLNSSVLKELVARIRPCHSLSDVNILVNCGGGKSFPSSHAANNFAAATVITYFFKKNYIPFYLIAVLISVSRVYVGVHYPIDIFAGAIVGLILGFLTAYLVKFSENKLEQFRRKSIQK